MRAALIKAMHSIRAVNKGMSLFVPYQTLVRTLRGGVSGLYMPPAVMALKKKPELGGGLRHSSQDSV